DSIHAAVESLSDAMAEALAPQLERLHATMRVPGPYSPDATAAGRRALGNSALMLLTRIDGGIRAGAQYGAADNMTQQFAALAALVRAGIGDEALEDFRARWQGDRLVMDKWFNLQPLLAAPERAARVAAALAGDADFDWKNPNRFRALIGGLAGNAAGFHAAGGAAYELTADWLIRLDPVNPQTTARMSSVFETWRRFVAARQAAIRAALERLAASPGLSRDTGEMVQRILAA
ncbi:MAG: aminopeptidase N C-terminal domain-containing protein, partial [Mangrovicoccus sp.]|nr:aminopeptidase N C-terminal domain-containing protein [Mangrovicoccus sp.]